MPSVGTASTALTATTQTAAYTATAGQFVLANATSAAFTVTLPTSTYAGATVSVKKTDSSANQVTVVSGTSATIDGDSTAVLISQFSGATFTYDGANWRITATTVFNTATSATGSGPQWTSGRYYTKPGAFSTLASATPQQSALWAFYPLYIPNACTISQVNFYCGATSTSIRAGLFTDSPSAISTGPATLIGTQLNYTYAANASNALGTGGWTVPAQGLYWVGYSQSAANSMNCWTPAQPFYVSTPLGAQCLYYASGSYSTVFPSSVATYAMSVGASGWEPLFGFKIA